MKAVLFIAHLTLLFCVGCAVSGHYVSSGPCKGFHTNQLACQRAAENAVAIVQVKIGQTIEEVSKIMGRAPERREAAVDRQDPSSGGLAQRAQVAGRVRRSRARNVATTLSTAQTGIPEG